MDKEAQKVEMGNYYILYENGCLKISITDHKSSLSILPSSGNCIVLKPVPAGSNQMKE